MDALRDNTNYTILPLWKAIALAVLGAACFQVAYSFPHCAFLIAGYLWCLAELTRLKTSRQAFYIGLLAGIMAFAPQMNFLWTIFGAAAICLWLILAFWIGMFVCLGRFCRERFGAFRAALLIPFLWTGLEYFRSEIYYLRFSWLNEGYVFANRFGWIPIQLLGVYGIGFILMAAVSLLSLLRPQPRVIASAVVLAVVAVLGYLPALPMKALANTAELRIAGMQMEFPVEQSVVLGLNQLAKQFPQAQLFVLSEYTFMGPIPDAVKNWCRKNQRYLIVGGEDPVSSSNYYNTAFVIGPTGDVVFRQAKSVPVQFFRDGLPATNQAVWNSPWGKLGLCICYDLSYRRVTDNLVSLGAQAIIVPTMDVANWGRHQHELHSRVAPTRSAEFGVPIFRLASSGISQCVDSGGRVSATAPMPGDLAMLSGTLRLPLAGSVPLDHWFAPFCTYVTAVVFAWMLCACLRRKKNPLPTADSP